MRHASQPDSTAPAPRSAGLAPAALLGAAALLISLPLLRLWPPTCDEGQMLTGAAKLLRGGIFYRDVLAFPTPGGWYLLAAAIKLAGESVMVARALAAAVFAVTVALFYLIARRLLGPGLALAYGIALLALKFWAWPAWSAYLYAEVALAFGAAGALAFLVAWQRQRGRYFFIAGALFGTAAFCKQTVGVFPALAALALLGAAWAAAGRAPRCQRLRALLGLPGGPIGAASHAALLVAGGLAALLPWVVYFAAHGLLPRMCICVLPSTGYVEWSSISYLDMLNWSHFGKLTPHVMYSYDPSVLHLTLYGGAAPEWMDKQLGRTLSEVYARLTYLAVPLFLAAWAGHIAWRAWKAPPAQQDAGAPPHAVALLLMLGLSASAWPRMDYYHVIDVAPAWLLGGFAAVQLGALAARRRWTQRAISAAAIAAAVAWFALGAAAMAVLWVGCDHVVDLPRCGPVRTMWTHVEIRSVVDYIRAHTAEGTPLFVLGLEAYCYFLADRYSPWPFAQMYPGQTGPDQGQQLARLIEQHRIPYIVRGRLTRGGNPPIAAYAPALVRYVARNYHEVQIPRRYVAAELWLLARNNPTGKHAARGGAAR